MRDLVTMLESEARRKPEVAELLDRARSLTITEEEIDSATLPLPWFRKALKEALSSAKSSRSMKDAMERLADVPITLIDGVNSQDGITAIYKGDDCWVKAIRGFLIEVRFGDLLFFPKDGGAWLNQTYFDRPPQEFKRFTIVEEQTRHEYVEAYMVHLNKRYI